MVSCTIIVPRKTIMHNVSTDCSGVSVRSYRSSINKRTHSSNQIVRKGPVLQPSDNILRNTLKGTSTNYF